MRSTFIATGAFVGSIDGDSRCSFWADEPTDHGFDKKLLISVDLSRTPSAAAAGEIGWEEVEVDDCMLSPSGEPSGTTLGPRWPELQLVGAVNLEMNLWKRLPEERRPACPTPGAQGRDYEFMSVVYWPETDDPRAGMRYMGHHGEILEEQGTLARIAIYPPGASLCPSVQPMAMWIDLASPEQCDAGEHSLTQIGVGDGAKSGALFLFLGKLETSPQAADAPDRSKSDSPPAAVRNGTPTPPITSEDAAQASLNLGTAIRTGIKVGAGSGPKIPKNQAMP